MDGWYPRFNKLGQIARGHAVVTVDGVSFGEGIAPHWYTDTMLLVKRFDDKLYFVNTITGDSLPANDVAINQFAAGGSSFLVTAGERIFVSVSREGEHAWVIEHNGSNTDRSVFTSAGAIESHKAVNWCRIEAGHVVWSKQDTGEVWGKAPTGLPQRLQLANAPELIGVPIPTPEGMWVLTMTHTELRLAPWGGDEGYVLALGNDNNLNPDAIYLNGKIKVAWNNAQGQPGQTDVDLSAPRTKLLQAPQQPLPTTGNIMIKSFERPFWMAPFYSHSERYGDTPLADHMGNSIIVVGDTNKEMARVHPLGIPMIAGAAPLAEEYLNTLLAWWESGLTIEELETKVRAAHSLPERPIIAYLDKGNFDAWPVSRPDWITDRVWPSVQAYRDPGEPLGSFRTRVTAALDRLKAYNCMGLTLTPAFYTRNGAVSVEHILECMPLYEHWVREYPIVCFMPFADRRPTGMLEHPALREWAKAFMYAVPSTRPNRFDYWKPEGADAVEILENKLGQSRAAVVLEPYLRELILEAVKDEDPQEPEPEPGEWPDLLPTLQKVRAKYGEFPTPDQCVAICNEAAWLHKAEGFGLLLKTGGNRGKQPKTGIECSVDWLVSKTFGLGRDCLVSTSNSETGELGPATPIWGEGEPFDTSRWIAPVQP